MLKNLLYRTVYFYIKIGLHLFYKKIDVVGLDNIPKKGAVLFVANHQNAMMDPILIGTNNPRPMYFLARASAFKNKIVGKFLNAIHTIAIYRVRDGVNSKKLNEAVFNKCNDLLNNNKSILIFPEGSHSELRKVRSLRSGFTRITFDFLKKNPNKEFHIIPIGLNYTNRKNYAKEVKIIYGEPILVSHYKNENINKFRSDLINETHQKLIELTVHIDENYEKIVESITEKEFLTPNTTNQKIQDLKLNSKNITSKVVPSNSKNIFYYLMLLNSIIPFLFWKWLQPKVKQKEFISTAKFSVGLLVFPVVYLIQTLIINHLFSSFYALIYILFCFFTIFLSTKTR